MDYEDILFHKAFRADVVYKPMRRSDGFRAFCRKCNTELKLYYCENSLYAVKCEACESITLLEASNPLDAARVAGNVCGASECNASC